MKRNILSALPIIAFMLSVADAAKAEVSVNGQPGAPTEAVPASWGPMDQKKINFVLAEVRKRLETNHESQVTELSVDPEYRSRDDTYLINAMLESHELKYSLGVLVTLHPVANGWEATMGFID